MRQAQPRFDWMKANSFQEREADTDGSDVMPNKMAKTNARTPETRKKKIRWCILYSSLKSKSKQNARQVLQFSE
jgi:hypothetical protein